MSAIRLTGNSDHDSSPRLFPSVNLGATTQRSPENARKLFKEKLRRINEIQRRLDISQDSEEDSTNRKSRSMFQERESYRQNNLDMYMALPKNKYLFIPTYQIEFERKKRREAALPSLKHAKSPYNSLLMKALNQRARKMGVNMQRGDQRHKRNAERSSVEIHNLQNISSTSNHRDEIDHLTVQLRNKSQSDILREIETEKSVNRYVASRIDQSIATLDRFKGNSSVVLPEILIINQEVTPNPLDTLDQENGQIVVQDITVMKQPELQLLLPEPRKRKPVAKQPKPTQKKDADSHPMLKADKQSQESLSKIQETKQQPVTTKQRPLSAGRVKTIPPRQQQLKPQKDQAITRSTEKCFTKAGETESPEKKVYHRIALKTVETQEQISRRQDPSKSAIIESQKQTVQRMHASAERNKQADKVQKMEKLEKTVRLDSKAEGIEKQDHTMSQVEENERYETVEQSEMEVEKLDQEEVDQKADRALDVMARLEKVHEKSARVLVKSERVGKPIELDRSIDRSVVEGNERFRPSPMKARNPPYLRRYFYYLGPGNNCELVRRVLQTRPEWTETTSLHLQPANFKWQQTTWGFNYDKMNIDSTFKECLNHFEYHRELTTKSGLIRNLQRTCHNAFDMTPLTYLINLEASHDPEFQWFINFYIANSPTEVKKQYLSLSQAKVYYSFTNSSMIKLERNKSSKPVLLEDVFVGSNYLWLLKPTDFNRGNGISVFSKLETLENLLNQYYQGFFQSSLKDIQCEPSSPRTEVPQPPNQLNKRQYFVKCRQFVIQKYVEKPFLIEGRKFDIRMWGMVTQNQVAYMFKQGYIRTSSELFNLDSNNLFVHLTNNAVQKYSKNYGLFESGNQMSFPRFQQYLDETHPDKHYNFEKQILALIRQQMIAAFMSVKGRLNKFHRKNCFEVFGFDFIIDETFRVWLIEVNTNPCIEESSPLLSQLIPRMLDDAFKLSLDTIFPIKCDTVPRPKGWEPQKKPLPQYQPSVFPVDGYNSEESMWDLICQL